MIAGMSDQLTLLTVHAHPDDETISTGGVMARYAAEGVRVVCVTCTGGEHGEIVVPEMDTPSYFGGTATVPFEGVLQRGYQFQYSTNLTTWNPIFSFTNTVDRVLLTDPNAGQSPFRFYRVIEP